MLGLQLIVIKVIFFHTLCYRTSRIILCIWFTERRKTLSKEQDYFSFELEENLFFDKGQEVSEMLSVALDPEITIHTVDDDVSIRGVIKLSGEYQKSDKLNELDEQTLDFQEQHSKRYLERVEDKEGEYSIFSHQFPVDISIPSYRVLNLNDITVDIDSFDYELPNENQLKINAAVHINGISQNNRLTQEKESKENALDILDESFEFEITEESLKRERENVQADVDRVEEPKQVENSDQEEEEIDGRFKIKHSQSFEEFFNKEVQQNEENTVTETEKLTEIEELEETKDLQVSEETSQAIEVSQIADEEEVEELHDEQDTLENVDYLARMFQDKEENDRAKAQMKICIVQEQDTLESIAERYQIPKLHILKQNRLEDDTVEEGQLLSIPFKKN